MLYYACAKRPYFRFRFEDVFSCFSSEKQQVRHIFTSGLFDLLKESMPRVEPPTLIISIKFEVDTTTHRRVTAILVRIRHLTLRP